MKNMEDTESLKKDRKLLKPQVERRRRERMNRSLENLRLLLVQDAGHQVLSQRRVEKAEILEQTVLFLQSSVEQAKGAEGYPFLEGFSACMDRATRFLKQEGGGRGPHASGSAPLQSHLSRLRALASTSPKWVRVPPRVKLPEPARHEQNRSAVCMRRGPRTVGRRGQSQSCGVLLRHMDPNANGRHGNTAATSRASCGLQAPVRPCVWRPWP
ncbi:hairy and enhancer of split related-7 [Brachyhypopomus gauderio]|uniref:hairy and enhancer of split related-7 n=1 Tax=Brachyhypopomus gauderio TaxID=698409 RepID=UPI0040432242